MVLVMKPPPLFLISQEIAACTPSKHHTLQSRFHRSIALINPYNPCHPPAINLSHLSSYAASTQPSYLVIHQQFSPNLYPHLAYPSCSHPIHLILALDMFCGLASAHFVLLSGCVPYKFLPSTCFLQ